jgi:hypothetical protein
MWVVPFGVLGLSRGRAASAVKGTAGYYLKTVGLLLVFVLATQIFLALAPYSQILTASAALPLAGASSKAIGMLLASSAVAVVSPVVALVTLGLQDALYPIAIVSSYLGVAVICSKISSYLRSNATH